MSDSLEREPLAGQISIERISNPAIGVFIVAHFIPPIGMSEVSSFMNPLTKVVAARDPYKTEREEQTGDNKVKALRDNAKGFSPVYEKQLSAAVEHYAALADQINYGVDLKKDGVDTFGWPEHELTDFGYS